MLGRVFMRQASRAFNGWSEAAHERRRALRFGRRLIDRGQVKALGSWQDFCHQRHRLRSTMRRILHANLARALNTWMEQATAHRRLRRFGRRLLGRVTSRALNGWLDFVRGKHKAMSQRRWAAARFGNPRLSAAWNQWLEGVPGSGMCCAEPKADNRPEGCCRAPHALIVVCPDVAMASLTAPPTLRVLLLSRHPLLYVPAGSFARKSKFVRSFMYREQRRAFESWLGAVGVAQVEPRLTRGF